MKNWQDYALCKGFPSNWWFPVTYQGLSKRQREKEEKDAKAVCACCPVKVFCLNYALQNREREGVWGGKNEIERRLILKQQTYKRKEI